MEFGGYLPFELNEKKEYYVTNEKYSVLSLNNGRTAIWYAMKQMNVKKVVLPLFYCPTVIDMLKEDYEIDFYRLNDNFLPEIDDTILGKQVAVILVNFYGVLEQALKPFIQKYKNIIIDNAHAFFSEPVIGDNIYNVYSCRKFIGVADGAYVVAKSFNEIVDLDTEISYERYLHLLKSIEFQTSDAYDLNLMNERYVGSTRKHMSKLTKKILSSVDYEEVKHKRISNFNILHSNLHSYQRFENIPKNIPAYCYPLYLSQDIRDKLIARKIWVPTMWRELIIKDLENSYEYNYSKRVACLPIDQRYSSLDMIQMSRIVIECIND